MIFKNLIIRILFRLLDKSFKIDYKQIDKKAVEQWAFDSFDNPGWRSYFAYEDLKLLKSLRQGQSTEMYYMNIGRSIQLLYMFDEMRRAFQNRKTRQEKEVVNKKGSK